MQRIPQYQINAVNTRLDRLIQEALEPAVDEYAEEEEEGSDNDYFAERIALVRDDIDDKRAQFDRRVQSASSALQRAGEGALEGIDRTLAGAQFGEGANAVSRDVTRNVVPALQQTAQARTRLLGLEREAQRALREPCAEIDGIAEEFGVGVLPDEAEIVDTFLRSGPFVERDRLLGQVEIDPEAFASAFGRDRLTDAVRDKIDALRPDTGPRAEAIAALRERCQSGTRDLVQEARNASERALDRVSLRANQAVPALLDALNTMGVYASMASGNALRALADALGDAFGIEVPVEVSAPETENDILLAQLLQACDEPYPREDQVRNLALSLGIPFEALNGLDARGVCAAALNR